MQISADSVCVENFELIYSNGLLCANSLPKYLKTAIGLHSVLLYISHSVLEMSARSKNNAKEPKIKKKVKKNTEDDEEEEEQQTKRNDDIDNSDTQNNDEEDQTDSEEETTTKKGKKDAKKAKANITMKDNEILIDVVHPL